MQSTSPLPPSTPGSAMPVPIPSPSAAQPAAADSQETAEQSASATSATAAALAMGAAPATQQPSSQPANGTSAAGSSSTPSLPAPQQQSPQQQQQQQQQQRRPHLYVGNISPSVTETSLHDIFATVGPVASVKIIPDRNQNNPQVPPQATRYAFIEYVDIRSAEQALQSLNGHKVAEHEIRVNWAHQAVANGAGGGPNGAGAGGNSSGGNNANGKGADDAHVFVGDLAPEINDEALRKAFSAFGSLAEARVMWDMVSGKSRGYGFLTFQNKSDAQQAIATMNGEWLGSRAIRVNWANQKNSQAHHGGGGHPGPHGHGHGGGPHQQHHHHHQGGHHGGPGGMHGHGGPRGGGGGQHHHHNMHGGGPQGYNAGMGGPPMMGMGMPGGGGGGGAGGGPYGMGAPGGSSMPPGMPLTYEQTLAASHLHNTTVYVGNLLPFTTQNDLVPYFQNYGYITEVRMQADRGFAFVRLDSHENAAMAISQLNGTLIHNRPIKCGWGKDRMDGGGGSGGGGGGGRGSVSGGAGGAGGAGGGAAPPPPGSGYGAGGAGGPGGYGNMMYGMPQAAQYPYAGNAFGGYPGAAGAGGMGIMTMPGAGIVVPAPGAAGSNAGGGGGGGAAAGADGGGVSIAGTSPGQGGAAAGNAALLGTSPSAGDAGAGGGLDAAAMQQQMAAAFGGAGGQGGYGGVNGAQTDYYNAYATQYGTLAAGGYGYAGAAQAGSANPTQGR